MSNNSKVNQTSDDIKDAAGARAAARAEQTTRAFASTAGMGTAGIDQGNKAKDQVKDDTTRDLLGGK